MIRMTTKDILAESFLELTETRRIDKIRISDITGNCGMSAPTFYNYFKDKYDLMVWIYVRDVKPIISQIGIGDHNWLITLREAADYYWKNKGFVVNALKHTGGHESFYVFGTEDQCGTNDICHQKKAYDGTSFR